MFIILKTVQPANGFFRKRRQKKNTELSEPVSYPTDNGLPFFILDVLEEKNGIDWNLVEEKCGRYVSRIVAPRNISLPDNSRLKRFVPTVSNGILIFNTAADTIKKAELSPEDFSITVADRNASLCSEIQRLIPLASCIRVITSRPERYASICQSIYDDFGASVAVRTAYEISGKPDIVICCDGATSPAMENSAVFSFRRSVYGRLKFFGSGLKLSEKHEGLLPENIDSSDFASAINELCASTEYKSAIFLNTEISCQDCKDKNGAKCLRCYVYKSSKTRENSD